MKTNMHSQCRLQRDNVAQVSWIPTEFATEGRLIDLKENGKWDRGWTVVQASGFALPSEVIQERERDYKNHRKATDV